MIRRAPVPRHPDPLMLAAPAEEQSVTYAAFVPCYRSSRRVAVPPIAGSAIDRLAGRHLARKSAERHLRLTISPHAPNGADAVTEDASSEDPAPSGRFPRCSDAVRRVASSRASGRSLPKVRTRSRRARRSLRWSSDSRRDR